MSATPNADPRPVLVTGATGFLGGLVVDALLARGHRVRALVRPSSSRRALDARGVEVVTGSFETGAGLDDAVSGAGAVVHLAGGGLVRHPRDIGAQNLGTTRALLAALDRLDPAPARFVMVSSMAAHGPSPDGRARHPDAPCAPVSAYGRAKAAAEVEVTARAPRLPVTIVRPPAVYGPGDTRMLPLFRSVARGVVPVVGRGRTTSLVFGADCAAAIASAVDAPQPPILRVSLADGPPHPWETIGAAIARALGRPRPPRALRLPPALVTATLSAQELAARLRGRATAMTRDKARDAVQRHWVADLEAARRALGWAPAVDLDRGMTETVAWYRNAGWL